jgi:anti-sigma-K factor RskA
MHRERLEQMIRAYGAEPQRWPPAERDRLRAALEAEPELLALLAQESRLDAWLAELPAAPAPSADLAARILASAPPAPRFDWRALWAELGGSRMAAPALACALTLGLALAVLLPAAPAEEAGIDTWLSLALLDEGLEEDALP